ncbi:MAG: 50S ribosomal protein L18 [Candidatus Doudnabacteria bacterium]|nr:50S ribosomal protein L18 [Candidatus Doudnabacteria bacterium]
MLHKQLKQQKRRAHIRKNVSGVAEKPRLSVYRSNKHIYAQLIDDVKGVTLAAASDHAEKGNPVQKAAAVGAKIAQLASKLGISTAVFDRGGYKFHGRVKSLADSAREAGLKF